MIFPKEYKYIGVSNHLKLGNNINNIYFLSKYVIEMNINNKNEINYRIIKVTHEGKDILRKIKKKKIIAENKDIYYFNKKICLTNRKLLILISKRLCDLYNKNTVIFIGYDNHITFVHEPDILSILTIEVLDIEPPKENLYKLIKKLDKLNIFGDLCIQFKRNIFPLNKYKEKNIIFPCSASELKGKFLDVDLINDNDSILIGCDTSKLIFECLYPSLKYKFIELCPIKSKYLIPTNPFITRCCKKEMSGKIIYKNNQKGVVVHWGASEYEVIKNIRKLVKNIRKNYNS